MAATVLNAGSSVRIIAKDGVDGRNGLDGGSFPGLQAGSVVTDRTAEFDAAGALGSFTLSRGSYTLATSPMINDGTIFGLGAKFAGPAYPPGLANGDITNAAGAWFTRAATNGFANYTHAAQLVAYPGGSHTRKFESAAHIASILCYDNSTYVSDGDITTPGVELSARDYVGNDSSVYTPGGLNLNRVRLWGSNNFVVLGSSSASNGTVDGAVIGTENRIDNWGADSGEFSTSTQKFCVTGIGGGNKKLTAGFLFAKGSAGGGAYYGVAVDGAACVRYAFAVMLINGTSPQRALGGFVPDGTLDLPITPASAVAAPPAQVMRLFFDSANANKLSAKNSAGTVTVIGA